MLIESYQNNILLTIMNCSADQLHRYKNLKNSQ